MKYVIFKDFNSGIVVPIVFSELVNHCDVKAGDNFTPVAAGFCKLYPNNEIAVIPDSRSESLNLDSTEHDQKYINNFIRGLTNALVSMDLDDNYKKQNIDIVLKWWNSLNPRLTYLNGRTYVIGQKTYYSLKYIGIMPDELDNEQIFQIYKLVHDATT